MTKSLPPNIYEELSTHNKGINYVFSAVLLILLYKLANNNDYKLNTSYIISSNGSKTTSSFVCNPVIVYRLGL
mgnify:CR=1 FL=1